MKNWTLQQTIDMPRHKLVNALNKHATEHGELSWLFYDEGHVKGNICLVAHIDTVHESSSASIPYYYGYPKQEPKTTHNKHWKDRKTLYDSKRGIMWSPDGLGADDRAGVYALIKIWNDMPKGERPVLLFCDEEESGAWGATEAGKTYDKLFDISFFIELDRQGDNDCVFYNFEPIAFKDYIAGYGFKEEWGSFSDISSLCEDYMVCGTNLSVGYYKEHTLAEMLDVNALHHTIKKVKRIIREHDRDAVWIANTDAHGFGEIVIPDNPKGQSSMYDEEHREVFYKCNSCDGIIEESECAIDLDINNGQPSCPWCYDVLELSNVYYTEKGGKK